MHFLIIGNPENRRIHLFSEAVTQAGLELPEVISYLDLLQHSNFLKDRLRPDTILRIESPGENFKVEKALIALGATVNSDTSAQYVSSAEALQLPHDQGRIRFLRQWFLGYDRLLEDFKKTLEDSTPKAIMNTPEAIRLMFDKIACQQQLSACGVDVPMIFQGIENYESLKIMMQQTRFKRVFIKPAHTSSASGVIAYRIGQDKEEAITSIEIVRENGKIKFYNSLKVRQYTSGKDIQPMIDFILQENAIVEEWIPKATLQGHIFDIRVVVIDGKAKYILPRLSKTPLTNLHLGNKRGEVQLLKESVGIEKFTALLSVAEKAGQSIPGAFYAGVDIAIPTGSGQPKVLEVNAFGDLLPNLLLNGQDTYSTEVSSLLNSISVTH